MLCLHKRLESTEGAIQNEKSTETRAILGTRHITKANKTTTTKHIQTVENRPRVVNPCARKG
jgi:hypothetical protein